MAQTIKWTREATFGTIPNNTPWTALLVRQSNLQANPRYERSQLITTSRRHRGNIRLAFESGGDIPSELVYGNYDGFIPGALFKSDWTYPTEKDNNVTAGSITDAETTTDTFTTTTASPAWAEGMLVRATGFTNAGNNALHRATSSSDADTLAVGSNLVDETPPATARLKQVGFRAASGDAALDASAKTVTISAASGVFTAQGLAAGKWVKMSGWTTVANNTWVRVVSVTGTVLTWDLQFGTPVTEPAAAQVVSIWFGDSIEDGTDLISYGFEQDWQGHTKRYHYFSGQRVNTLEYVIPQPNILLQNVSFVGKSAATPTNTRGVGTPTDIAAPTGQVFNSADHVAFALENGTNLVNSATALLSARFTIGNNLQRQPQVGAVESAVIDSNDFTCQGDLEFLFNESDIYEKVLAGTLSSLQFLFVDPAGGRGYVIDMPTIQYTSGSPPIPPKGGRAILRANFEAQENSTLSRQISIQRIEEFV